MGFVLLKKRRLLKAEESFNLGKKSMALKQAKPLLTSKNKEFAYRANRLSGLALYKQRKYQESIPLMEAACQLGNYRHDWYNLSMAFAFNGHFEKADEAFQNIYRTNVQSGYMYAISIPAMLFQYMKVLIQKGNTERAIRRANELKQMYAGTGISDVNKQIPRGLPAYPTFRKEIETLFPAEKLQAWEKQNQ